MRADPLALLIAQEGLRNGHYEALERPWERTFLIMPLAHAEGADHLARLDLVVVVTLELARAVRLTCTPSTPSPPARRGRIVR
jgi:uncharacterized protein (DUF924 family)